MMEVLQLSEDFYPKKSGGAFTDWKVASGLVKKDHDVTVVTPRADNELPFESRKGVEIRRPFPISSQHPNSVIGQMYRLLFFLFALIYLVYLTSKEDFDVIYSTNHLVHPLARILSVIRGYPVVNFVAYSPSINDQAHNGFNLLLLIEQLNFRFFMGDLVLCRTPAIQNMIRGTSGNSARLIDGVLQPNKIRDVGESTEYPPECIDSEDDSKITILYVGRFEEVKNPIDAIELIAALPAEYRLLMIGDGPLKENVRKKIKDLGVASQVRLLGSRQHKTTLYYIKKADVLLLTSKIEAYPTVVFEALALETPVLATPVGILSEVSQSRLLLSSIEEMPAMIKNCDFKSGQGLDSEVLMNYSIDHFVNEVDRSLSKVSRHTDTGQ